MKSHIKREETKCSGSYAMFTGKQFTVVKGQATSIFRAVHEPFPKTKAAPTPRNSVLFTKQHTKRHNYVDMLRQPQ
jgi:hypothetical protein